MVPYPTVEDVLSEARSLGEAVVYGQSVEGRDLVAVTLPGEGPLVVVTGGLHGIEYIGVQVALEVLRQGPIEGARLAVLPLLNPDGYARTWNSGGDAPVGTLRKNARGVDLNRNFPMPWGATPSRLPFTGSADPGSATYRGPQALSEPEAAALARWLEDQDPCASANVHSFSGVQIAARCWERDDWRGYSALCRAFRRGQGLRVGYPRVSSPWLDVFTGELEDWQHHGLGCWSVCVESFSLVESVRQHLRAPTNFWRFNPRDPAPIARRDAAGVREMLRVAAQMPRPPRRPGARVLALPSSG